MTLKSLRAGFSTPRLGLQAPPRLYECWTLSDRLRCNCTTRNRYISLLHDSIQKGDPHPHLHAFHLHVSRRKATPTMGRPSWPDHAARRYSEPGSPPRRFGTHTSTPAQTSLSAARSIEIPDLGSRGGHSLPSVSFRRCRSRSPMENHRAFAESLSPITWRFASLKADLSRRGVIQCARGLSRTRTQQPSFQGSVYTAGVHKSCGCKLLAARFLGGCQGAGGRLGDSRNSPPPASADLSIQPWSTSTCSFHGSCVFSAHSCDILLISIDLGAHG